ncbi:Tail tape measure protein, TIGR01760 family [Fusobacterium necrophorum subsp. funduliforme]|uniref:phage tail tape measure protein n=1 Tax=Fusobacterium necrophorum TaxID=859 RepID=UPI000786B644|nr:phage tail tape measure protein [Fusobacterium necrophorum]AYV94392.1 phage tail tape measure protein [Fusobacterium necrophorum subsp. funduliforme]KYL04259.1 phage tail tape measure protein [Fusobacterium necrophorum subsp. funduliforme]KYM50431.1 phage tail tape measure protein [Fusobacterium necrophorum subsp. funduliforme]KYM51094.1 phage tail tape measure protein [Fusobacterium necrophorum subsp. funduliforme]MDK4472352.1 phage tail tape measure protein [Fusobacterium necrophorum]
MSSKGMNLIIRLKGHVDKMLPGHLKKVASQAKELRARQEQLKRAMRVGREQQQLKKEMRETNKIYVQTRREMKLLENVKKAGKALTEQEKQKYQALNQKAKELEKTIKSQSKSYQKYGMELKKLKIPFDQLQSELEQTKKKYKELTAQQRIAGGFNNFKQGFGKFKEKVKSVAKTALAVGTAAAIGIGVSSAQDYLQFDKQIVKVKALTGATTEEFQALKQKAMEVGKTTIFTADEAAAGMEKFALAGFKPKEIIAALPGVFDLAAASGEDFVMISDMISDHMQAFNLSVNDIGGAADILANTMARSNTNVQGLSEAFKYASAGAHDLHMDLATTAATVGLMGDQAIKSGQAGRDLKAAFSKIADSGIQNKLKKLGVQVKGTDGEFIGMVSFVRQLQKVTKMPGIDKLGLLKDLFGDQGSLAMNKLLTATKEVNGVMYQGADALEQFARENANAQGKAKEMANILLEDPSGKWALLKSAISDVKLRIGEAIFTEGGTDLVSLATQYANELSNVLSGIKTDNKINLFWQDFIENAKKAFKAAKEIGVVLWNIFKFLNTIGIDNILVFISVFSMTSKVIAFGKAISGVFTVVKSAGGILSALQTGIAVLGGPISLLVAVVSTAVYLIYKNWDWIKENIPKAMGWIKEKIASATAWLTEKIIKGFMWLVEKAKWVGWNILIYFVPFGAVIRHWDFIKEKALLIFGKLKEIMFSLKEKIKNFFVDLFNVIPELIRKTKDKTVDFIKSIPGVNLLFSQGKEKKKAIDGSHAGGLPYVPFNGYIAELHRGERVLTKEENESIFGSLRSRLSTAISGKENSKKGDRSAPITITMQNHFTGVSEETKSSIIEVLERKLQELQEQIIKIQEGEETRARLSL